MVLLVAVVSAVGNVIGGQDVLVSACFGSANAAEAALAGWWITRGLTGRPSLRTLTDLARLVVGAAMGAAAIGAGATATVVLLRQDPFWPTLPEVTASHLSAVLLLMPLALRMGRSRVEAGRTETVLQCCSVLVVCGYVFAPAHSLPLAFVLLAPLVWGALRLAPRVVAWQLVVIGFVTSTLTIMGGGPFAAAVRLNEDPSVGAGLIQTHIVVSTLVTMSLVLAVDQRRSVLAQISTSERMFRGGFNEAMLGMIILRSAGEGLEIVELNEVAAGMLVGDATSLIGSPWLAQVSEDEQPTVSRAVTSIRRGEIDGWRGEVPLVEAPGQRARWVEVAISPIGTGCEGCLLITQMVDVTSRRDAEESLAELALHDALTGLPNRVLLRDRIHLALRASARSPLPVGLLFVDLDDFKRINDTAGHEAGDEVLMEVGRRLAGSVRPGDTVGRLGGDEFVILLPSVTSQSVAAAADRVMSSLADPITVGADTYRVTASLGAVTGDVSNTVSGMMRDADTAMYVSKTSGRARVTFFTDDHRARAMRTVRVTQDLDGAVARGELRLHIQPIVDLLTGRIVAGETLVRWQHPKRGLLLPADWLDVAETSGEIHELGRWVLAESCRLAAAWSGVVGSDAPRVHVNVSGRQLERGDLCDQVRATLASSGLPGDRLVVELTETEMEQVRDSLHRELEELRDIGVCLAIDDFGTGYSAFSRLTDLPVDILKIDRSFVAAMLHESRSKVIVSSILSLAGSLGLDIVAEGIETPQQEEHLRRIGCRTGQGYYWSPAVTPDAFLSLLTTTPWERNATPALTPT